LAAFALLTNEARVGARPFRPSKPADRIDPLLDVIDAFGVFFLMT
jgi:hypothetical protein